MFREECGNTGSWKTSVICPRGGKEPGSLWDSQDQGVQGERVSEGSPTQAQASGRGEGSPWRAGGHGPAGVRGADRELGVPSRLEARRQLQHTFNVKLQTERRS